ncbi:hypothetical protein FE257_011518 [Aspergillus nanangensis]|uniref:Cytochrome P450 monooxygenase otaC n=1 Tax=Aspergillus nanangensis TaxID=2582783 RepID=A0AAD4CHJ9_ASPNN|nr:hypothetical protein FE257_011518 [Aspergillus nanangensis]
MLGLLLLYLIYLTVYRLWLCPIAKFPGPRLAALTLWYEFYYDAIKYGKYTFRIAEMHKKYGPIVRISPYELHIDDSEYYEVLYSRGTPRNKYEFYTTQFGTPLSVFSAVEHEQHKILRSHMNPFFSMARVRRLEPTIQALVDKLCQRLREWKGTGASINIQYAYTAFATDVVTEYTMGPGHLYLDAPDFVPMWSDTISGIAKSGVIFKHFPWMFPIFMSLPPMIVTALNPGMNLFLEHQRRCDRRIRDILESNEAEQIQEKVLDGVMQPTLFHDILSSKLPGIYKSHKRLAQEMQVVIGAGAETTAKALAFITFYLLNNPEKQRKLKQELAALDPKQSATLVQFEQMPYLNGVILEGLRLSYGLSTRLQRSAPYHALKYKEWTIPPNTPVGMTSLFMHHNEKIFPDSYTFTPERWLDPEERKYLEKYMVSFSKGSRQCVGMNLARTEMFLVIPKIFRTVDLELFETTVEDVRIIHDLFLPFPKTDSSKATKSRKTTALEPKATHNRGLSRRLHTVSSCDIPSGFNLALHLQPYHYSFFSIAPVFDLVFALSDSVKTPKLDTDSFVAFDHAAAGHEGIHCSLSGSFIAKPCTAQEVAFYESSTQHPAFREFMPTFIGTLSSGDQQQSIVAAASQQGATVLPPSISSSTSETPAPTSPPPNAAKDESWVPSGGKKLDTGISIVLENVASGFKRPNVLDVKLGARLWADDAPLTKRSKLDAVSKETTSSSMGFRIAGMKVWTGVNGETDEGSKTDPYATKYEGAEGARGEVIEKDGYKRYDKWYGRSFHAENVKEGFEVFLAGAKAGSIDRSKIVAQRLADELNTVQHVLQSEESRMYSASVLIVYEGDPEAMERALQEEKNPKKAALEADEDEDEDEDFDLQLQSDGTFQVVDFPVDQNGAPQQAINITIDPETAQAQLEQLEEEEDEEDPPKVLDLRLIDFAHANWTPGEGPDENSLAGVRNLVKMFSELAAE